MSRTDVRSLAATAHILRAERVDALLAVHADADRMKTEAESLLNDARKAFDVERSRGALAGQRAGALDAQRLLDEAEQAIRTLVESLEPEIALLAVAIAERILGQFDDRDLMVRAAARAIEDLREDDRATLYIAPRYLAAVRARLAQCAGGPAVAVEPGEGARACTIVTARGTIDAGIGHQLESVRQTVRSWAGGGKAP
jgi:type III secretion protein L